MREIKMQAWDNVKNKMYAVGEEGDIHFVWEGGQTVGYDLNEEQDSPDYKLEHLKYREFTGLKDKNGVEIYEGDIIHVLPGFNGNGIYAEVYYKSSGFALRRRNELDSSSGYLDMVLPWINVIGNVYENPEILEVKR